MREAEPGKPPGKVVARDQRRLDAESVAGTLDILDIIERAAGSRSRDQTADGKIEFDAALQCNFRIAIDRAPSQTRPDRVVVDRTGDAGIVVMTGENAAVVRPVLRLIGPISATPAPALAR